MTAAQAQAPETREASRSKRCLSPGKSSVLSVTGTSNSKRSRNAATREATIVVRSTRKMTPPRCSPTALSRGRDELRKGRPNLSARPLRCVGHGRKWLSSAFEKVSVAAVRRGGLPALSNVLSVCLQIQRSVGGCCEAPRYPTDSRISRPTAKGFDFLAERTTSFTTSETYSTCCSVIAG